MKKYAVRKYNQVQVISATPGVLNEDIICEVDSDINPDDYKYLVEKDGNVAVCKKTKSEAIKQAIKDEISE